MNKENCECMEFPKTFEEFVAEHSFKDSEEIYTNGSQLIQVFRLMQGYEHFEEQIREDERKNTIQEMLLLTEDWKNSKGSFLDFQRVLRQNMEGENTNEKTKGHTY